MFAWFFKYIRSCLETNELRQNICLRHPAPLSTTDHCQNNTFRNTTIHLNPTTKVRVKSSGAQKFKIEKAIAKPKTPYRSAAQFRTSFSPAVSRHLSRNEPTSRFPPPSCNLARRLPGVHPRSKTWVSSLPRSGRYQSPDLDPLGRLRRVQQPDISRLWRHCDCGELGLLHWGEGEIGGLRCLKKQKKGKDWVFRGGRMDGDVIVWRSLS